MQKPNARIANLIRYTPRNCSGKMKELVDVEEHIINVEYYTHPIDSLQRIDLVTKHAFIVFATETWWWFIEKNSRNVTFRRSKKKEAIICVSKKATLDKDAPGKGSVLDLIRFLSERNLVGKLYDIFDEKGFADRIWDAMTALIPTTSS